MIEVHTEDGMRIYYGAVLTAALMASTASADTCSSLVEANKAVLESKLQAIVHEAEMRVYFSGFASRSADPERLATAIAEAIQPMISSAVSDYQAGLERISTPCP